MNTSEHKNAMMHARSAQMQVWAKINEVLGSFVPKRKLNRAQHTIGRLAGEELHAYAAACAELGRHGDSHIRNPLNGEWTWVKQLPLTARVSELDIDARVADRLREEAGIGTIGQLIDTPYHKLRSLLDISEESLQSVVRALGVHGYKLRDPEDVVRILVQGATSCLGPQLG